MINKATLIGFIIMGLISINLAGKLKRAEQKNEEAEKLLKERMENIALEDSLCRVWVEDTAKRVAFKTWYKRYAEFND